MFSKLLKIYKNNEKSFSFQRSIGFRPGAEIVKLKQSCFRSQQPVFPLRERANQNGAVPISLLSRLSHKAPRVIKRRLGNNNRMNGHILS